MARIDPMIKYQYLIGTKINKWTILKLDHSRRNADAICLCECGTVKPVNIINLINNRSKDCGCGRKQTLREKCTKNLIGQRFGKLTVIELLEESNKFNRRQYRCKCDCGNEIIVSSSSLIANHTSSCGCLLSYYNMYIDKYLNDHEIEHQKEYQVIIDNKNYRFDFYLPNYNLFIEYDGELHFKPVRYYGSNEEKNLENFLKILEHDKIKNNYCELQGIHLLRIPYYEKDNIDTIINNCLQRLNDRGINEN